MTQGERIKKIRKTLGLTLEKFGERVGVGKTAISRLENESNNLTEQMTKSICREFSVDYIWLTTGEGEMFLENDDDLVTKINNAILNDDIRKNIFLSLLKASDEDILALQRVIDLISTPKN